VVCLADILPTFARAGGVELPEEGRCDGIDLIAAARGEAGREDLVGSCAGQFHMYLSDGYKYHFSVYGGGELLFDLTTDPREERNLADDPEYAERKAAMRAASLEELRDAPGDYVAGSDLVTKPAIADEDGLRAAYGEWGRKNGGKWPGLRTPSDPSDVLH